MEEELCCLAICLGATSFDVVVVVVVVVGPVVAWVCFAAGASFEVVAVAGFDD